MSCIADKGYSRSMIFTRLLKLQRERKTSRAYFGDLSCGVEPDGSGVMSWVIDMIS